MTAPRCRCCGKPLPRKTKILWFNRDPEGLLDAWHRAETPRTKEEAQRYTNGKVLRVKLMSEVDYVTHSTNLLNGGRPFRGSRTTDGRCVWTADVWDGESYGTGYGPFCTLRCGYQFGVLAARETDLETQNHADAVAASNARP